MKTLKFTVEIEASPEAVWDHMLGDAGYRRWTAAFAEGSHFQGSWGPGDRIRFLAPNGDGITSVIAESRPHERLSIKHLGTITGGIEDTESAEARKWAPSFETYTFIDRGGCCELRVDLDCPPEFEPVMLKTWPEALAALKALCEGRLG